MNRNTIDDFAATLQRKKAAILNSLTAHAPARDDSGVESSELEEFVQTERIKSIEESLSKRERILLREIEAALERIADGTYGICARCEEEINPARLSVLPTAEYCVECAAELEHSRPKINAGRRLTELPVLESN